MLPSSLVMLKGRVEMPEQLDSVTPREPWLSLIYTSCSFITTTSTSGTHLVLKDLHPNDGSPSPFTAMTGSPDHLIDDAIAQLPALHDWPGAEKMAVYCGIPKFHKLDAGTIKWRFLSYSPDMFSTPLAHHLTWLLKAIQRDILKLWEGLAFLDRFARLYESFWILTNSADFIPVLHSCNESKSLSQHRSPARLHNYDFPRLYTNLDHADLVAKLERL